jgi:predicted Fe-S protein YdhL (DUF1289 family)
MIATRADSPCIKICIYDYEKDYCSGCGRTLDEMTDWRNSTPEQKQIIRENCKKRLDSLSGSCYNHSIQGEDNGPE